MKSYLATIALIVVIALFLPYSQANSQPYPAGDPLLQVGRDLSMGYALVDPLPLLSTLKSLQHDAIKETARDFLISTLAEHCGIGWAGEAMTVLSLIPTSYYMWAVATGRADPHKLLAMCPSVVLGWDLLKGPQNIPVQHGIKSYDIIRDDMATRIHTYTTTIVNQNFSSKAQGLIKYYGFDPGTDRILRQTVRTTTEYQSFSGARFNGIYNNPPYNTPIYSHAPTQTNILPRSPTQVYTPPTQVYTPPTQIYIPPQTPVYIPRGRY
ncbi:MAG: hypothetical protein ABSH17_15325 [Syntrophobacteraceae bacterium]|jgi:hypothetical protein